MGSKKRHRDAALQIVPSFFIPISIDLKVMGKGELTESCHTCPFHQKHPPIQPPHACPLGGVGMLGRAQSRRKWRGVQNILRCLNLFGCIFRYRPFWEILKGSGSGWGEGLSPVDFTPEACDTTGMLRKTQHPDRDASLAQLVKRRKHADGVWHPCRGASVLFASRWCRLATLGSTTGYKAGHASGMPYSPQPSNLLRGEIPYANRTKKTSKYLASDAGGQAQP